MDWFLETAKCVYTWTRKDGITIKEEGESMQLPLNNENFMIIDECSWVGCGLNFYDKRPIFKKARIKNRYYAFCSDECYSTWLRSSYFHY